MSKIYSKEERAEALKLASEIGVTAASRKLGINANAISNWKNRKPKPKESDGLSETELRNEVKRLRKELDERTEEVEILQAACGFFASRRVADLNRKK